MSSNEKTLIDEEYYSYEKFIWVLLNEAHRRKIPIEVIGQETSERTGIIYPIYRMTINPECPATICIVTGVHGNEIAGPLSILHMVSSLIHDIPHHYRYIIYPVINPTGFDLRQRFDADYRDLNAVYKPTMKSKNYKEVQVFFEDAIKFAPFTAVMTLHEDSDLEKFYMYGLGEENRDFYHAICGFAKTWISPWSNADIYGCQSDEHGLILARALDHAFDGALYSKGHTKIAFTLETPGKLNIHFRVNMMAQLVFLSLQLLQARTWMVSP